MHPIHSSAHTVPSTIEGVALYQLYSIIHFTMRLQMHMHGAATERLSVCETRALR